MSKHEAEAEGFELKREGYFSAGLSTGLSSLVLRSLNSARLLQPELAPGPGDVEGGLDFD